ncbi:MAG: hypothetical protein BHW64_06980 [Candidatus Melainabacteria bacterium LEY3_CP_29_8]|nr:MAG: hypothetical protein BHW64_06980 [Candidatus Melainabacteria bacterium LEY3_CP_29_8]
MVAQPLCIKAFAISKPMPVVPPVIRATLPSNKFPYTVGISTGIFLNVIVLIFRFKLLNIPAISNPPSEQISILF